MVNAPRVSVLMAVYDTPPALLDQAIGSILSQTWSDFEFLILDDGSRSAPVRLALARAASRDARIHLYTEPHRGLTATLNRGLALARGVWIARQDADDWSEPERLDRQAAFFEAHPDATLLGSAAWTHQQDGTRLWQQRRPLDAGEIREWFWRGSNPFLHGSVMFRAEAARAAGGYREELPASQDYDFFWRLQERGLAGNLAAPLYHYRFTAGSVSASRALEQARAHRAARHLAEARARGAAEIVAAALAAAEQDQAAEARAFRAGLKQADHLMLAGEYGRARPAYRALLRMRPLSALAWAKLGRLGVFRWLPAARKGMCFR